MTRPLLEQVLRRRIARRGNVVLQDGVVADRVEVADGVVTGMVVGGVSRPADLIVDCSGRSSRIAHQLASAGILAPPISRVTIDCAYTSGFLSRSAGDFEGTFLACGTSPPTSFRGGAVLPVEGDRWMVTLAGVHGDAPGTSEDEVLAFARSLLSPAVAQLIERVGPLSAVASYRFPFSQRRHYEKVARLLPGLVTLGDAACSFNPIYGQGMSCAALQAEVLGATVRMTGARSQDLPQLFHRRAAKIIDAPWAIAVGADFLHPQTAGPKARGTDAVNRYVLRVVKASHRSVHVARSFNLVLNLVEPTSSLVRPSVLGGVLAASVPGPHRQAQLGHPRVGPPSTVGSDG